MSVADPARSRLPPGPLPLLVALATVFAFLCGLPGAGVGQGGALLAGGPAIEVTGHYLPADRAGVAPIVGSGPEADLRLTETDVPDHLARLIPTDRAAAWVHDSTANSAAFYRDDGSWIPGVSTRPDALVGIDDGERLVWSDDALSAEDGAAACAGKPGTWGAATVGLVDATGAWLLDGHGDARTIEVPMAAGAERPLGDGAIAWDGAHLWLLPRPGADPVAQGVLVAGSIGRWRAGRDGIPADATARRLDRSAALAMGLDRALPGMVEPAFALGGNRFVKPDVYVAIDGAAPLPIGVTGDSEPLTPQFHVFRRRALAESSVPGVMGAARMLSSITGDDPADRPRVGRTPGFAGRLYGCHDGEAVEIGREDLRSGDIVLAGRTTFAVGFAPGHAIDLDVTEPPAHRVHALASLSIGQLRSSGRRVDVPACAAPGQPSRSLVLRGETGPELVPEGVEPVTRAPAPHAGQDVWTLPLPAWAARIHPDVQAGATTVDLVELCVDRGDELVILDDESPPNAPLTELSGTRVPPGAVFGVAGHQIRYTAARPLLEQILPLVGFLAGILALTLLASRDLLAAAGPSAAPIERHGAMWAVGAFAALLAIGGLLQLRMAASEHLLGSADYLQRHLLTGFLAAAGMRAAVDVSVHADTGLALIRRLFANGRLAFTLLLGWLVADWAVFAALGTPSAAAGPAIHGDLVRSLLAVAAVAAVCWIAPLILMLAPIVRLAASAAARVASLIPDDDEPAPPSRSRRLLAALRASGLYPSREVRPLLVGAAVLLFGVLIGGSGRAFAGFDLKPAEFAPWPIGLGLAGLLVGWSRTGSSWGRLAVPLATLAWLALVTGVVVACYALRGDFGPLMVLVPAMLGTVVAWVLPWNAEKGGPSVRDRLPVLVGYLAIIAFGVLAVLEAVPVVEAHLTEIPGIGTHVQRAADRFATHGAVWYTQGGHWSTTANWIAAGYFGDGERYVSNLHSDLAFVALMQSFHWSRALVGLGLFLLLVGVLAGLGDSALARAEHAWKRAREALDANRDDREARRRYTRHGVAAYLDAGITGYFLLFSALYLACEVLVHVGTCFNTLPQTGITLPWVSSGGSASVGFAILLGAALARAVGVGGKLAAAEATP
jgi:cell division protein FtsW (lipid II flippase)